jgi:hypothetical protein
MSLVVQLPEAVERRLRAKAEAQGTPLEVLAANVLTSLADGIANSEDWLDIDYHAECEADKSPEVSLEEVRQALSKIPSSLVADFSAERDE